MAKLVSQTEQKIGPKLYRGHIEVQYTFADLTEGDGSQLLTLPQLEGDTWPLFSRVMITQYISGGTITDADIATGFSATPLGLMGNTNAFDTTALNTWSYNTFAGSSGGGPGNAGFQATGDVTVRVNTTDDDVANATAGAWVIGYWYDRVED